MKGGLIAKSILRAVAPGGKRGLSILLYHRVLARPDPLFAQEVDADRFRHQLGILRSFFNVLPLAEAVARLRANALPPRAACITFDDGYADNVAIALPLLLEARLHATFFIATAFLDGGRMWNDSVIALVRGARTPELDCGALGTFRTDGLAHKRAAIDALIARLKYRPNTERIQRIERLAQRTGVKLPTDLMMTRAQLRELHRAGMDIGAHTVNHPILTMLPPACAAREIGEGKAELESITGAPVTLFAYPNGKPCSDYDASHVAMVRSLGFDAAVSTAWGRGTGDVFQLPRFTPWDRDPRRFVLRMARNLSARARACAA